MKKGADEIKTTTKFYDSNAAQWVANKTDSFYHETAFQALVKLWPKEASIIDIGCANGIHVPLFLGIGRTLRYTGMDISKAFLKVAQRRYPQLPFLYGNIADLYTLPKQRFTGFVASAVLMHIPFRTWSQLFDNIEKLVQPGAFGYITLPIEHPNTALVPEDNRHFTLLSEAEQRTFFKDRNWKVRKAGTLNSFKGRDIWRWYIVQLPS